MKLVFVSGSFNVIHPGHQRLLKFAKQCGDELIVGVYSDKIAGLSAHITEDLRLEGVQANSWVDKAFLIEESVTKSIDQLKPDIVIKGKEYESRFNPEIESLNKYGGSLIFSSGESLFSSADILRREFNRHANNDLVLPKEYCKRHKISKRSLVNLVEKFKKLRICVIGDLIIDEYIECQPLGMSQEDPTLVVTPVERKEFIGGAGIVAAHGAGLGSTAHIFSVIGNDELGQFAKEKLQTYGVHESLLIDDNRPTTHKEKYRSNNKSLLRVSKLYQGTISKKLSEELVSKIEKQIKDFDLIIFSDFNYGCISNETIKKISEIAIKNNVLMIADSQSSSQTGNISRFQSMDLITPTEIEARISLGNKEDGLVILAEKLRKDSLARNILLKLGSDGLLIHAYNNDKEVFETDRLGVFNKSPVDISGAGDSLLVSCGLALASGGTIFDAALLGSLAASVQVGRIGNTPIKNKELLIDLK